MAAVTETLNIQIVLEVSNPDHLRIITDDVLQFILAYYPENVRDMYGHIGPIAQVA